MKRRDTPQDDEESSKDTINKKAKPEMRALPSRAGRATDLSESAISKRLAEEEDAFRAAGDKGKRKSSIMSSVNGDGAGSASHKKNSSKKQQEEEEEEEDDDDDEEEDDSDDEDDDDEEEEEEEVEEEDGSAGSGDSKKKANDEERKAQARERTRLWRLKRKQQRAADKRSEVNGEKRAKREIPAKPKLEVQGGGGGGSTGGEATKKRKDANHVHEPPKQLRFNKPPEGISDHIYIKEPACKMKHFDWGTHPVKWFDVGAYNSKGERIHKDVIREANMIYKIVQEADGNKGPETLLEDRAALHTKGSGSFYTKIPHFRVCGKYTMIFKLAGEEFKRVPPLKFHVTVDYIGQSTGETGDESHSLRSLGGPLGNKSSSSLGAASAGGASSASNSTSGHKRHQQPQQQQQTLEEEFKELIDQSSDPGLVFQDAEQKGRLINLIIPGPLRRQLCDDWFAITRRRRLVQVPAKPSAMDIVRGYEKEVHGFKGKPGPPRGAGTQLGERLLNLFEGALGHLLLYRFEMEQYVKTIEGNGKKALYQLWGAHHLLRLLVIMPRLLTVESTGGAAAPSSNKDWKGKAKSGGGGGSAAEDTKVPEEVIAVRDFLQGLIDYMVENHASIFPLHVDAPQNYALDVPRPYRA